MIATSSEYLSLLYRIQDPNRPVQAIILPSDERVYEVDLNTRVVEAPECITLKEDHNAETVYFKMDRYFDNIDLARPDITILIQYENASKSKTDKGYFYCSPFIDIATYAEEDKILFPWVIEEPVTAYSGTVKFSIRIYSIARTEEDEYSFKLNLSTLTSTFKVLAGLDVLSTTNNYSYTPDTLLDIYSRIQEISQTNDLYWIEVDDL